MLLHYLTNKTGFLISTMLSACKIFRAGKEDGKYIFFKIERNIMIFACYSKWHNRKISKWTQQHIFHCIKCSKVMLKNFTQCKLYSNINKRNLINMHLNCFRDNLCILHRDKKCQHHNSASFVIFTYICMNSRCVCFVYKTT